jgi:CP family cyanate transporter-like MFS transporter
MVSPLVVRGGVTGRHRLPVPAIPVSRVNGRILCAVAIVAVALNLRSGVTSLGAVLGELSRDWQLSGSVSGILTALPVCTFATVGATAPALARRFGPPRLVALAMLVAAFGLAARAMAPSVWLFGLASVAALAGAAIGNVLLPPLVKRYFPDRVGVVTAMYTTALALGMTGGAALTVPAERAFGGDWRVGLMIWAALAAVAVPPWLVLASGAGVPGGSAGPDARDSQAAAVVTRRAPVRRARTARWLALYFGCQSLNAYVVLGWLPSILAGAGLDARSASLPLALSSAMSIPMALVVPGFAARRPNQYGLVVATTLCYAGGYVGLMVAPAAAPLLWAALLGAGNGALPLAVTMISFRSGRPEITTSLSALAQSAGYLLAATGPLLVGVLHQSSGGWSLPLLLALSTLIGQLVSGVQAASPGTVDAELDAIHFPKHRRP